MPAQMDITKVFLHIKGHWHYVISDYTYHPNIVEIYIQHDACFFGIRLQLFFDNQCQEYKH